MPCNAPGLPEKEEKAMKDRPQPDSAQSAGPLRERRSAAPRRVDVPLLRRLPSGVLWCEDAVGYHAIAAHYSDFLGHNVARVPARLDALREAIRAWSKGLDMTVDWGLYRGRHLACPKRCPLNSPDCPVDLLLREINRPSGRPSGARGHPRRGNGAR